MANRNPQQSKLRADRRVQAILLYPTREGKVRVTFEIDPATPPKDLRNLLAAWVTMIQFPYRYLSHTSATEKRDRGILCVMFAPTLEGKPPLTQGQTAIQTGESIRRIKKARERFPEMTVESFPSLIKSFPSR